MKHASFYICSFCWFCRNRNPSYREKFSRLTDIGYWEIPIQLPRETIGVRARIERNTDVILANKSLLVIYEWKEIYIVQMISNKDRLLIVYRD